MSVSSRNQTASKLDAFAEAVKLRNIITKMIMANFGLKREKFDALIGRQIRDKYPELKGTIARIDAYQNENVIRGMYQDIGIELNERKTKIVKLSEGFKCLKGKVHLTETGRGVMRPDRGTITRERQKLKALRRKLDEGKIQFSDVRQAYNSWSGHIKHFDSYCTRRNMDKLFRELFQKEIKAERSGNNGKEKHLKFRGEFKQYDFPERISPAERRHTVRGRVERDDIRKREAST